MNEVQKFTELKESVADISDQKIRIEERFKNCKSQLEKLLKEITDKGYDPKKLSETRTEKEAKLKKALEELEEKVQKAKSKLDEIEV
jgi:threonine dehydrogenase-like Zn-dependent dehydrogenase